LLDEKPPPKEKIGAVTLCPKIEKQKMHRIAKIPKLFITIKFASLNIPLIKNQI
jgi:hypothetical protein